MAKLLLLIVLTVALCVAVAHADDGAASVQETTAHNAPLASMGAPTPDNMDDDLGRKAIRYISFLFHKASADAASGCGNRALAMTIASQCTRQVVEGATSPCLNMPHVTRQSEYPDSQGKSSHVRWMRME